MDSTKGDRLVEPPAGLVRAPEPPAHVLDEETVERGQIREMLTMTPAERLRCLSGAYRLHRARAYKSPGRARAQDLDL